MNGFLYSGFDISNKMKPPKWEPIEIDAMLYSTLWRQSIRMVTSLDIKERGRGVFFWERRVYFFTIVTNKVNSFNGRNSQMT